MHIHSDQLVLKWSTKINDLSPLMIAEHENETFQNCMLSPSDAGSIYFVLYMCLVTHCLLQTHPAILNSLPSRSALSSPNFQRFQLFIYYISLCVHKLPHMGVFGDSKDFAGRMKLIINYG